MRDWVNLSIRVDEGSSSFAASTCSRIEEWWRRCALGFIYSISSSPLIRWKNFSADESLVCFTFFHCCLSKETIFFRSFVIWYSQLRVGFFRSESDFRRVFHILRRSSVDNHVQTKWNMASSSAIDTRTWCKGSTRALSPWLGLASITFFIDFLASWMLNWCIDAHHIDKRTKRREEKTSIFLFFHFTFGLELFRCENDFHDSWYQQKQRLWPSSWHGNYFWVTRKILFCENEKQKKKKTNCYSCTLNHCSIYTILMNLRLARKQQQSYTCVALAPSSTTFEETVFAGASDNVTI